mgnify:CR=1 FL=1
MSRPPRSAYLHLPFCHRRCFYCDFPVVPLGDRADGERSGSIAAYLELLLAEIAHAPQPSANPMRTTAHPSAAWRAGLCCWAITPCPTDA